MNDSYKSHEFEGDKHKLEIRDALFELNKVTPEVL
jgi:hypothetical protein